MVVLPHLPFRCRRWKKLKVIAFVARYPARKEDGMIFGILKDKPDYILDVRQLRYVVRDNRDTDTGAQPILQPARFDGLQTLVAHGM